MNIEQTRRGGRDACKYMCECEVGMRSASQDVIARLRDMRCSVVCRGVEGRSARRGALVVSTLNCAQTAAQEEQEEWCLRARS